MMLRFYSVILIHFKLHLVKDKQASKVKKNTDSFSWCLGTVEPRRPIPNSDVKRCSSNNTWGVAPWEDSPMPGNYFTYKRLQSLNASGVFCLSGSRC
jgi:hypothetical protein